ncbi:MAG: glycoside hydrolase family 43 protein [Acidimicrobiales bacterium]
MQQARGQAVHDGDFADPFVLRVGSTYYAYATNAGGRNVQVMVSQDLAHWEHLGDALPRLPAWAAPGNTWAPVVLETPGRYVLYYTVREARSGRQAISAAASDRPEGPYADDRSEPLVFQVARGGSIDPSPFVDDDGAAYLLWKSDDNALQRPSSLWAQRLSDDGLSLAGEATELLRHDRSWERPLVEAPSMVRHGDTYYLFYSGNWWESNDYAVGYATGPAPLGPFRKATRRRAWFVAGMDGVGPGGQEFFTDTDGALRMAYHAWTPGTVGYGNGGARSLRIARVTFTGGEPVADL